MKNNLMKSGDKFIRVLDREGGKAFVIDCIKRNMPKWIDEAELSDYIQCEEDDLLSATDTVIMEIDTLSAESKQFVHSHFSLVAGILPYVSDKKQRDQIIALISEEREVSKQTIRHYLCDYLAFQNIAVFAPKTKEDRPLTKDEKNIRWALNKFFYTKNKNSLNDAYTFMLKYKYTDADGTMKPDYPTINQFKYYYRKTKKLQTFYISRDGMTDYQRNNRPLLGDGVQEFTPYVGMAMLDATVCDIYLINEVGGLVGRPILTAAVDGFSSLCVGYGLQWEGGIYSVKNLTENILADKVEWCKSKGVAIYADDWNCNKLPAVFITDGGSEYTGQTFEQLSELGVTIINLPSYRPELKGNVEKFFDLVQETYKTHLKGKGVIEPDFQQRGAHDYRKDACLTMADFEKVIIHCIKYYNSQRIIENYPYTDEMLKQKIAPYANQIFSFGCKLSSVNLLDVDIETVMLTLLPRTIGTFTRKGLKVNKMRYSAEGFTEEYLRGGEVTVAYNPDNVNTVYLVDRGTYTEFNLIESRYIDKSVADVEEMQEKQKELVKKEEHNNLQAKIDLATSIQTIASLVSSNHATSLKSIRENRTKEREKTHKDFMKVGAYNG